MKEKQKELIDILKSASQPLSSTQLATYLKVTPRTIKNYVRAIQMQQPDCILSSANGYSFNQKCDISLDAISTNQTFLERSSYIIRRFFVDHVEAIDIYDLCDELYLSYSSIKSLLNQMNKEFQSYQIAFRIRKDILSIDGDERHQRKFLASQIHRESSGRFVDLGVMKEIFPDFDVDELHQYLRKLFQTTSCQISDFGFTNIAMHLIILIERILKGKHLSISDKNIQKHEVTIQLIDHLQKRYHITISNDDQMEINDLIQMNLTLSQANTKEDLIHIVGEHVYQMTYDIITSMNSQYSLSLDLDTLLYPLALHFKNLFVRHEKQSFLKNPLLETIQKDCPLLFDCAIYIATYLEHEHHITIPNDEIAYLALHIGTDIERKNKSLKLQCVLLCPNYQDSQHELAKFLMEQFGSQIEITKICTYETEFHEGNYDIIFSTIVPQTNYEHLIMISPLKSAINLKVVFHQIQDAIDHKKLQILAQHFSTFFHSDLFYVQKQEVMEKETIIKILYQQLHSQGFVTHHFYEHVLQREATASTAFGQIAIPHSIKMDANHTSIAVAIVKEGVHWDQNIVHIVLLIAIKKQETYLFKELYEALILLFSQETIRSQLRACSSFEEFQSILLKHTT